MRNWLALLLGVAISQTGGAEPPRNPSNLNPSKTASHQLLAETAGQAGSVDKADTAWMLISSALVLMMTAPGLALFYGGLVRKKNILSVMMQCIFLMGLMSLVWVLWGYSLAFGESTLGGFLGGLEHIGLQGVSPYRDAEVGRTVIPMVGSVPETVFVTFEMMFFVLTPALICGAFAERMRFSAMCLYSVLWGTLVYCPIAHWVWAETGWLCARNEAAVFPALDFAGGIVVHVSAGVSALVCSILLGQRLGYRQEPMPPHNLSYTFLGATLLWFGWFGFNAGNARSADATAAGAFLATHLAAGAGVLAWAGIEWLMRGKPSILGACSGAIAGLVCITPASGMVTPPAGILFGLLAGLACFYACTTVKTRLGYDDSLDAFGVHGVAGALGALLTGLFANRQVAEAAAPVGFFDGSAGQVAAQGIGLLAAVAMAAVGSAVLLKLLDATIGLRVSQDDELQGLDVSQHGEEGYIFL